MQTKGNSFKFRFKWGFFIHLTSIKYAFLYSMWLAHFYTTCQILEMSLSISTLFQNLSWNIYLTWFTQQFACGLHVIFCHKICNNCRMKNTNEISALPKHKKFKVKMVLQFILITFQSLRESLWSRRVLICDYYYVKIVTTKQETTVKATKHQTLACLLVSCWKNYFFLYLLMYFHVVMYF